MDETPIQTVAEAVAAALPAYDALTELGEDIEDEWSYVTDLSAAWRSRMDAVADNRGSELLPPEVGVAIQAVAAHAAEIEDPHRAIDWLSTYPQVVLIALGERP